MNERLVFDDRLLNRYAVEDLAQTQPRLYAALLAWFTVFGDFDDTSLTRLIAARGATEQERWKAPAQAALAAIPDLVQTLDAVRLELETALTGEKELPERAQLEGLLQSAQANRTTLVERVPALVARALGSSTAYDDARVEATAAVERTAQKLEQMRTQSEDATRSYRDLRPLVAELKQVWSELNRALAALSRTDQRAAREPHDRRMRAAANAVTRNLFMRKMQERARGDWPAPELAVPRQSSVDQLAAALVGGDYAAAHATLAPWLASEWSAERLASELQESAREVAAGFDLDEPPPAGAFQVGSSPMRYQDVRELRNVTVPAEVTPENYQGWYVIQIQTEEEDGYLTDIDNLANVYAIVISTPAGERIGYLEFAE